MSETLAILSLLDTILGPHYAQKRNEYVWSCPFCHHHKPKLAVNVATGNWHCWVCETAGRSLRSLLKRTGASQGQLQELSKLVKQQVGDGQSVVQREQDSEVSTVVSLPKEYIPLWEPTKDLEYRHAIKYCIKRGITADDILRYQIGYAPEGIYAGRIIIPSYNSVGALNYFVGRSYYDAKPSYKNPPVSKNIVVFESLISWKMPIVLCEGVMDAIAIKRNAIPLLGKTLSPCLLEHIVKNGAETVYIALDTDALNQAIRIAESLLSLNKGVYLVRISEKDPSEAGFVRMMQYIQTAQKLTFNDVVKLKIGSRG